MTLAWDVAGATHVGRVREGNEDAYRMDLARGVFLVADGMGGHAAGEVASRIAADTTLAALAAAIDRGAAGAELPRALSDAMNRAHAALLAVSSENPETRGMGTTLTAAVVDPAGLLHAVHIGDSRLYLFGSRGAEQLTRDHTWVRSEIDAGRIAAAHARNHPLSHILTHVLTDDADPVIDTVSCEVEAGDVLLLATDGLYNMLDDARVAELASADVPVAERVECLVREANRAGGMDNVTVVLIRLMA